MGKTSTLIHAALALLVCANVHAQGGFSGPGRYVITNVRSGKVLYLDRTNRTTVLQVTPRGTNNQAWEIQPAWNGYYFIRNLLNGYALTVLEERNGAPLEGAPFSRRETQMFRIEPGRQGDALIVAHQGSVLDVPDGSTRDGVPIHIFERNGEANQCWVFALTGGDEARRPGDWDQDRRDQRERTDPAHLRCSSEDGGRNFCEVNTGRGVRLVRQLSGSSCEEGRTWGYDRRGIWVDRGCRGEFAVNR